MLPTQLKLIICHPLVGSVTLAQGSGGGLGDGEGGGGEGDGGCGEGDGGGGEGDGGGGEGDGGGGEGEGGGGDGGGCDGDGGGGTAQTSSESKAQPEPAAQDPSSSATVQSLAPALAWQMASASAKV